MSAALRDDNRAVALVLQNTLATSPLYPTAVSLTSSVAQHVAIVDGTGTQITSFGGGTQYADAAAVTTKIGTGIIFNNGGTYNFVSAAQPLPITIAGGLSNPLPVSGTFWQSTQPVSIATAPVLVAGSAIIGKVGIDQTTPGTTNLVALAANQSVNVAQINGVTTLMGNGTTGTGSQRVTLASDNSAVALWGHGATAATVPVNAQYKGARGTTALPAAVTDGQLAGVMSDKFGRQVVIPGTIRDLIGTQTTTIAASTSETTIVTAAASIFNDLLLLVISNTSATAVRVDIRDTTAGSVLFSIYVPAGDIRGFSLGGVAIPQTSVNTNWTAQSSASVTDLRIYAVFAKNK